MNSRKDTRIERTDADKAAARSILKPTTAKYRKRAIVIDAYQASEAEEIHTLEGVMRADPGDWIIVGVKGERYPCKPDIFEMTYEPVDGETRWARREKDQ